MSNLKPVSMTLAVLGILALSSLVGVRPAAAQATPQFFFTLQGGSSASPLTSLTLMAGQEVTLSVWYAYQPSSFTYYTADVFVGFDRSSTAGEAATPLDTRLALGQGLNADTAVTNINTGEGYSKILPNVLAGGAGPAGNPNLPRFYGVDVLLETGTAGTGKSGTGATPDRLFDITLRATGNGAGGTQQVGVYTTGVAGDGLYNTVLSDGTTNVFPNTTPLNIFIQPVPEPSALQAILPGVGLLLLAHRLPRRRRLSR